MHGRKSNSSDVRMVDHLCALVKDGYTDDEILRMHKFRKNNPYVGDALLFARKIVENGEWQPPSPPVVN